MGLVCLQYETQLRLLLREQVGLADRLELPLEKWHAICTRTLLKMLVGHILPNDILRIIASKLSTFTCTRRSDTVRLGHLEREEKAVVLRKFAASNAQCPTLEDFEALARAPGGLLHGGAGESGVGRSGSERDGRESACGKRGREESAAGEGGGEPPPTKYAAADRQ